ncbi:Carboxynorspermidine/carboxyspermidine decarboxylase [bioreactor metagenome]|jgi:carboxynorspermidine decarboxylase|uniref:Carboxynorspermidine/carboxyspermidine decarboxylase n=1 Tax=bioreactor metagenome TaxID=1076179 RepID=A0A644X1Q2_9ZZZZ|nr:carboxynorspermidine decarboxylase [Paludibacter sp.]
MINYNQIPSPCFVLDEVKFRNNLELLRSVKDQAGIEIILAFKAFAMWSAFPIVREYIPCSTASSLAEARLAFEEMGSPAHTYAPAYSDKEFDEIMQYSSHITFNSLAQFEKFYPRTQFYNISCGLRINPEFSDVGTDLYNPCSPGSRLGIIAENLGKTLPEGVEGLHFHTLCESNSFDLERTLLVVEQKFGHLFSQIKWLNMGGGHLMTREGYNTEHLIQVLKAFKAKHPHLQLILEPGSAFAWRTGDLVATVLDVVENKGVKTAMLDVSFSCHMPDCLEMPYKPAITGATDAIPGKPTYRMGGNSCLAGDFYGDWSFDNPLQAGDRIIFEDMIHYTMVKTTMFNGVSHPSIGIWTKDNGFQLVREFGYEDYKGRLS